MESTSKTIRAHLTLVEVVIAVVLLGVAGFFLVRNVQRARLLRQTQQLIQAIEKSDISTIKAILEANPSLFNVESGFPRRKPLHLAVEHGEKDLAELLLSKGSDVNEKDFLGGTPLFSAVSEGQTDLVELLLSKGADVDAKFRGETPLLFAVRMGRKDLVKRLVAKGADVNAEHRGWTALHYAVLAGFTDLVEFFLSRGADVNAKNDVGETPLDLAKVDNRQGLIDLLRKHDAKE